MDKELLKKYMQAMSSTKTTHGSVPMMEGEQGYTVSLELILPKVIKGLKAAREDTAPKAPDSFRASISPIREGGRLVRSVSGMPQEVLQGVEEAIKHIENYYQAQAARNADRSV